MADREKVIHGLKCIIGEPALPSCQGCKYYDITEDFDDCVKAIASDALELLGTTRAGGPVSRPYEAHVLTVEEIRKLPRGEMESIPVVIESKIPVGEWDCGTIIKWAGSAFAVEMYRDTLRKNQFEWYTYGKTTRFWSAMPTMEQREAVKWDE